MDTDTETMDAIRPYIQTIGDIRAALETKSAPMVPNTDPMFNAPPRFWGMRGGANYAGVLVWRATDLIANYLKIAKSVWVRPDDPNQIAVTLRPEDPIERLFHRPNRRMSWAEMRYACETYRLLCGGWIVVRIGSDGKPTNKFPISLLIFPITQWKRAIGSQSVSDQNDYYRTDGWRNDNLAYTVADDECVVYSQFDPSLRDGRISAAGFSDLPARVKNETLLYQSALLRNDNRPGLILSSDKTIKEANRARLEGEMMSSYGGVVNAGRTMLLTGDGMSWKAQPVDSLKLTEISSAEHDQILTRDVGTAFGIPESVLTGNMEHANRANGSQVRANFLVDTVEPGFEVFEGVWNYQFFEQLGLPVRLDIDQWSISAFRDVAADRMGLVKARLECGDTPEAAYRFARIPFEANKFSTKPYIMSTLVSMDPADKPAPIAFPPATHPGTEPGKEPPKTEPPAKEEAPKDQTAAAAAVDDQAQAQSAAEHKPAKKEKPESKAVASPLDMIRGTLKQAHALGKDKRKALAVKIWANCVTPHEPEMLTATTKCVRRQKGQVMKALNTFLNTGKHIDREAKAWSDPSIFVGINTKSEPHIPGESDLDALLPDEAHANAEMQLAWKMSFDAIRTSTENQMLDELGDISAWLGTAPEGHRDIVLDRLGDAVKVNDTIRTQISDSLRRALGDNAGAQPITIAAQLRSEVSQVFDNAMTRANTIARTELGAVMSDYRHSIMKANGVKKVRWVSAHDAHVRPTHDEADAFGPVTFGDKFPNGLKQPHEPGASASEVINCRCIIVAA
jgi:hypothetical protein